MNGKQALAGAEKSRIFITRALCPAISVFASAEADQLAADFGFDSLLDLLAPYGQSAVGKITIKDPQGYARSHDDFCVRFIPPPSTQAYKSGDQLVDVEKLDSYLASQALDSANNDAFSLLFEKVITSRESLSSSPFETFNHPAAAFIVITSRNASPIEALSELYRKTHDPNLPPYINAEYLRYYVLLHDERDDVKESEALFEKMKRNFGIHCAMVKIGGAEGKELPMVLTDDDTVEEEPTVAAEVSDEPSKEAENSPHAPRKLSKTDTQNISDFVDLFVVLSLRQFMESTIATLNDQVAATRRGITGKLFSASRRYFSSKPQVSQTSSFGQSLDGTVVTAEKSTYDALNQWYGFLAPEALIRKLADFCFMLRNYKLAYSNYDLLRKDFHNDKAWACLAATQEMAAVSFLMHEGFASPRHRLEIVDGLIDSAVYSYTSRCSLPSYALRTILMCSELMCNLKFAEGASEGATKWVLKALNERLVARTGYAILMQHLSSLYLIHSYYSPHTRDRKASFWILLSAREWADSKNYQQSNYCINSANDFMYSRLNWSRRGLMQRLLEENKNHLDTGHDNSEQNGVNEPSSQVQAHEHNDLGETNGLETQVAEMAIEPES